MQYACQTIFYAYDTKMYFKFQNEDIFLTVMVHFTQMKKSGLYLVYSEYIAVLIYFQDTIIYHMLETKYVRRMYCQKNNES